MRYDVIAPFVGVHILCMLTGARNPAMCPIHAPQVFALVEPKLNGLLPAAKEQGDQSSTNAALENVTTFGVAPPKGSMAPMTPPTERAGIVEQSADGGPRRIRYKYPPPSPPRARRVCAQTSRRPVLAGDLGVTSCAPNSYIARGRGHSTTRSPAGSVTKTRCTATSSSSHVQWIRHHFDPHRFARVHRHRYRGLPHRVVSSTLLDTSC